MPKNIIESQLQRMGEIVGENAWTAMTPKRQLAYLYAYYEFFHANDGDIQSLKEADIYDQHAEDGVAGVYEDRDSDNRNYAAVVPVHFGDYAPSELRNSIVNLLHSAEKALVGASKGSYDVRHAPIEFFLQVSRSVYSACFPGLSDLHTCRRMLVVVKLVHLRRRFGNETLV